MSYTTETFSYGSERKPRRVRVPGREDIGVVVIPGKNFGVTSDSLYCVGIHFPDTGECLYYDIKRIEDVLE